MLFIIFRLLALLRQAIVVGDVTIEPAIEWEVASVSITFHKTSAAAPQPSRFAPKPEIAHEFRQPEARPPVVVSLAFTAIVLVPGVVLLGLWVAIGANISNFPWTDLNALVFHVALGGVLLLFVTFWVQLNIFECLMYLTPLALVLVFSGRNMLRNIATKVRLCWRVMWCGGVLYVGGMCLYSAVW